LRRRRGRRNDNRADLEVFGHSFDYRERSIEFLKKAPAGVIDLVIANILDLIDPTFEADSTNSG
jgi:hypothetical protein